MPKKKTIYVCSNCGYESPHWMGQCICGAWNSFHEEKIISESKNDSRRRGSSTGKDKAILTPRKLASVGKRAEERLKTDISELDRVLGGGLVKGSLTLISGEPGIGKSTLILQTAANIADKSGKVLYVSGEESEEQIKLRADRICDKIPENLLVISETNMEIIEHLCNQVNPEFLIIDSIQTVYTEEIDSAPGSISQVRACGNILMRIGKTNGIPIFIVAHVTKSGELAGPKTVEHIVDCVLSFSGDRDNEVRILRSYKNRFGTTNEIGAFRMGNRGLQEITNISESFLHGRGKKPEGSVVTATYEGSRPIFFEVQALASYCKAGFPRRTAVGIDSRRVDLILAVLEKKVGLPVSSQDIYINIAGGIRADGTSADLAVALAVFSSYKNFAAGKSLIAVGEIGLTGEVRGVKGTEKIIREALKLGYEMIIIPDSSKVEISSNAIIRVKTLRDAVRVFDSVKVVKL